MSSLPAIASTARFSANRECAARIQAMAAPAPPSAPVRKASVLITLALGITLFGATFGALAFYAH